MGEMDVRTSEYFENDAVFADMINGYFFHGQQLIKPEYLQEANKELSYIGSKKGKKIIRDNVKRYYENTLLCIYVLEHQTSIDYHMIIRNMLAEAMEYQRQWNHLKKKHDIAKDLDTEHEFLSGMKKTEKFTPVVSLVVYYGKEKWDAAGHLRELLDLNDIPEFLLPYISNYQIHVFDYHDYEKFDMFQTELKQVFLFKKYSEDKEMLKKLIAENPEEYYNISEETCDLIATITNSKELVKIEEYRNKEMGGINMCKALEDLKLEGIEEGIALGITRGIAQGATDKTHTFVSNMLNRNMSTEDICALAECSVEFIEQVRKGI